MLVVHCTLYLHVCTLHNESYYLFLRRVRDRLVAEDRFELAMEVSTKCQLDSNTVWTAWGMGCIKAGEFQMARDKFRHCFHVSLHGHVHVHV